MPIRPHCEQQQGHNKGFAGSCASLNVVRKEKGCGMMVVRILHSKCQVATRRSQKQRTCSSLMTSRTFVAGQYSHAFTCIRSAANPISRFQQLRLNKWATDPFHSCYPARCCPDPAAAAHGSHRSLRCAFCCRCSLSGLTYKEVVGLVGVVGPMRAGFEQLWE